jgi:hypothetical protein
MNRRSLIAIVAAWLAGSGPALAEEKTPRLPALNEKVVEFARAQKGKKVGDGSCLTLAVAALKDSGAKVFPLNRPDGNYVWGSPVETTRDALPGDILQFRDAEFQGKRWVTRRRWVSWHETYPHHTAIVSGVAEGGKVITVLHQNVGGPGVEEDEKKVVREATLRMDSLQKGGSVWIYRPVADGAEPPSR